MRPGAAASEDSSARYPCEPFAHCKTSVRVLLRQTRVIPTIYRTEAVAFSPGQERWPVCILIAAAATFIRPMTRMRFAMMLFALLFLVQPTQAFTPPGVRFEK